MGDFNITKTDWFIPSSGLVNSISFINALEN